MAATPDEPSVAELTRTSDLVFRGRVRELGSSAVGAVSPSSNLAVVELLEPLRVDPVLGDLTGRQITVELLDPGEVRPGEEAIFFTRNWIHGENLAVREVAHLPVATHTGAAIMATVAAIPDAHLHSRLDSADVVVLAVVASTAPVEGQSGRRQSPRWARAHLRVDSTAKGTPTEELDMYFPTGDDKQWRDCPRLTRRQRAVFLLRRDDPLAGEWLESPGVPPDALTALDPSDVLDPQSFDGVAATLSE